MADDNTDNHEHPAKYCEGELAGTATISARLFPVLGPSLAFFNHDFARLYPPFVKDFACQLARALDTMHALGVCHGDLTLKNVAVRLERSLDDFIEDELGEIFSPPRIHSLDYFFKTQPLPGPPYVGWPTSRPSIKPPTEPDIHYSRVEDYVSHGSHSLEDMISRAYDPRPPPLAETSTPEGGIKGETGLDKFSLHRGSRSRGGHTVRTSKEDAALLSDPLRRIFTYDYRACLTLRQILEHPWLKAAAEREGGGAGGRDGSE
ncbi:hypothetical protein C8A05DRAFT_29345 [Staphylotrichum tortipilum]|uniref:Protein kinase domain-containing protein n=1 Tax=Staphylotrichum tortipilum TaxID=2831512 RepID=A0AAN6RXV4_9PEZI|nr:hypothetical protein C8A05DRAFT_29345 [Staphylotrichum longicolle]